MVAQNTVRTYSVYQYFDLLKAFGYIEKTYYTSCVRNMFLYIILYKYHDFDWSMLQFTTAWFPWLHNRTIAQKNVRTFGFLKISFQCPAICWSETERQVARKGSQPFSNHITLIQNNNFSIFKCISSCLNFYSVGVCLDIKLMMLELFFVFVSARDFVQPTNFKYHSHGTYKRW